MAISIIVNLEASPNPTSLPRRVEFRQTLRSSRPQGEDIEVFYTLDPSIPFFFLDNDGRQVKQMQREETVAAQDQVCIDRFTMVQAGTEAFSTVQIDQTIQDAGGGVLTDSCVLRLAGSP